MKGSVFIGFVLMAVLVSYSNSASFPFGNDDVRVKRDAEEYDPKCIDIEPRICFLLKISEMPNDDKPWRFNMIISKGFPKKIYSTVNDTIVNTSNDVIFLCLNTEDKSSLCFDKPLLGNRDTKWKVNPINITSVN